MLHAYRLVYPFSQHAPPQLWEYAQPSIDHLLWNARTFHRYVVQWYFDDWAALDHDNTRIWETYYRPKPLFAEVPTWQAWLPTYRALLLDVQAIAEAHHAQGTWRAQPSSVGQGQVAPGFPELDPPRVARSRGAEGSRP